MVRLSLNAYKRLKNGESFEKVAKEVLQTEAAIEGGLIEPFKRENLFPNYKKLP